MPDKPPYDRPFVNVSGETIPAFAIVEIGGWVDDQGGVSVFKAVKPTKDGKMYLANGPLAVPAGRKGWAASRPHGLWVLYGGTATPALNQEYGPKAGEWSLWADGKGGFIIVDDPRGTAAPLPGFPAGSSTKRIRVIEQAKAEVANKIVGTVASTVSETTPQFLINKIIVISGVDPREDPNSQIETVVVENLYRKAYVNGTDRVAATQSKSDLKWYPDAPATDQLPGVQIYLARVVAPSSGISAAILGQQVSGAPVGSSLRMFKGYVHRYTVLDIADPGFGNAGDLAEPEREDSLSVTWLLETMAQAAPFPDTLDREADGNSTPELVEAINWVKAIINVGDRIVLAEVTTLKGRVRNIIIARDCG